MAILAGKVLGGVVFCLGFNCTTYLQVYPKKSDKSGLTKGVVFG